MRQYTLSNGKSLNIYRPRGNSAEAVLEFYKTVGGETDFLMIGPMGSSRTPEEMAFILDVTAEDVAEARYGAFLEGELVGMCSVELGKNPRTFHVATVGLSVIKACWGQGIGSYLMRTALSHAKRAGAIKAELGVRADNARAIALYERFGFVQCGRRTAAMCVDGEYYDELMMEIIL